MNTIVIICIFVIILAIYSVHAPVGNTQIGVIIDKIVQYLGIVAIPSIIFYFQNKSAIDQKSLEKSQQREKEQKYSTQARLLIKNIHDSFKILIKDNLPEYIKPISSLTDINPISIDVVIFYYARDLKSCLHKCYSEQEDRTLANKVLVKMDIFSEYSSEYSSEYYKETHVFFLDSLKENYKTEWDAPLLHRFSSFHNVIEKLAEEFSGEQHLVKVIEILKDIDNNK